mgnify:FL=1
MKPQQSLWDQFFSLWLYKDTHIRGGLKTMVKISQKQYREDRKKIIYELKSNPKADVKEIADKLGFSKQKIYNVRRKLNTSQNKQTFEGFFHHGPRRFIILAKMLSTIDGTNDDRNINFPSIQKLKQMGITVEFSYLTNGDSDVVIGISSESVMGAKMFCNMMKRCLCDTIRDIEVTEVLRPVEFNDVAHLYDVHTKMVKHH